MALIEETKQERQDGGYSRLFDNPTLGGLLSKIHATTIRSGNELEKIVIHNNNNVISEADYNLFIQGIIPPEKQLLIIPPAIISKKLKQYINCLNEPDFVIINSKDNNCYIIELKDGDKFDTKKSKGEIASLNEFSETFKKKFPQYNTQVKFCSFNCETKQKIVIGLKNFITVNEAMTGREFCKLIGISYDTIILERKKQAKLNIQYFIKRLTEIQEIKELLK